MKRRELLAVLPITAVAGCTEFITDDRLVYEARPAAVEPSVVDEEGYELEETDSMTIDEDFDLPILGERELYITNHVTSYSKVELDESTIEEIEAELAEDLDPDDVDSEDLEDVDPDDVDSEDLEDVDPDDVDVDREDVYVDDVDFGGLEDGEGMMGILLLLSTPKAEVAGQGINPIGRAPLQELVERVTDLAAEDGGEDVDLDHDDTFELTILGTRTEAEKFRSTLEAEDDREMDVFVYVTRVSNEDDYVVAVGVLPELLEAEEPALLEMLAGIEHPA